MNRITRVFALLTLIFSLPTTFAQTYSGDLSLTSQADVDAFNYSEVTGHLTVSGIDIVDLSPLSALTSIGRSLAINDNGDLVVVDGFNSLVEVGWGIYILNNPNLVSVTGFNALLATGDNIDIWYNDSLTTMTGFASLQTVGWSLEIGGNPLLMDIPEFESLQTISSSLFILNNASLPAISGFNALQYVDWSFDIVGNLALSDLCGFYDYFSFNNPYTGGGSFNISDNHPDLPSPTTMQDVLDTGPCQIPPPQQIDNLISHIQALELPANIRNNLITALARAQRFLEKGRTAQALDALVGLVDEIESLEKSGRLDPAVAGELIAAVEAVIDSIVSQ